MAPLLPSRVLPVCCSALLLGRAGGRAGRLAGGPAQEMNEDGS